MFKLMNGINSFKDWEESSIKQVKILYDENGKERYELLIIGNNTKSTGYIITDIYSGTIVEFSHGESPFETYLQKYLNKKGIDSIKVKDELKLVQNGIFQGYTLDDFNTIVYFTRDMSISIEQNVEDINNKKEINDELKSSNNTFRYTESIIPGVPNNQNDAPYSACGPVSGINIIQYWDGKGYSNLVTTQTFSNIYNALYIYMGSFQLPNGEHATSPIGFNGGPYGQGLIDYFDYVGNYNLSVVSDFNITTSDYSNFIKYEVDRNRPGSILFKDYNQVYDDRYGLHYTTLVGYAFGDEIGGNYYIIHDLWNPFTIYRNWDNDISRGDIWATFKIIPSY
ncbi:hypothetical protein JOC49_002599 [Fusibacter tunisiensis]|uniref:Peptidase C39-like domain-containing protein n=2 Tax=Fusibacter tunisiensis TaxID=1008308 RepID=A0ABS2MUE9_9FIRM|nr:hypothetical protein [Fusibacter tunisiensis]